MKGITNLDHGHTPNSILRCVATSLILPFKIEGTGASYNREDVV